MDPLQVIDITNKISESILEQRTSARTKKSHASSSSTPECPRRNKRTRETSSAKLICSKKNVPTTKKSSSTLLQVSTSSAKVLPHFWTSSKATASKKLWSPTKTDSLALESSSLNARSPNTARHSTWFRVNRIAPTPSTKSSPKISSQFVTTSWPRTTDDEPLHFVEIDSTAKVTTPKQVGAKVKTTKIKVHVRNDRDHERLRKLFGTVRFTYNQCVGYLREHTDVKANKKILRSLFVNNDSELVKKNEWLLDTGYDIRDDAISEFLAGMKGNFTKLKQKTQKFFKMNFKSKKRQRSETFYLRHRWIEQRDNTIILNLPKMSPIVVWTSKNTNRAPILMDCKFQRTWTGKYYLCSS